MPPERRPDPQPLDVNAALVIGIGTVAWFAAFCVLLAVGGDSEWVWATLAGWVLGLIGQPVMRLQHRASRRTPR